MSDILAAGLTGAAAGSAGGPLGAAAGAAISIAGALIGGRAKKKVAKAEAEAAKAVAEAANKQRRAKNSASVAATDLNRTVQGINNRRMLDAGVTSDTAAKEQLSALHDSQSARTFEGRVQAAERAGSLATQAALSGVAGGSFEAIQGTLALQQARREELQGRANAGQQSMLEIGMANQQNNLFAGLDTRALNPTLDRTITPTPSQRVGGSMLNDAVGAIKQIGVQNVGMIAENVWTDVKGRMAEWNWDPQRGADPTVTPLSYKTEDD